MLGHLPIGDDVALQGVWLDRIRGDFGNVSADALFPKQPAAWELPHAGLLCPDLLQECLELFGRLPCIMSA